jgi:GNAT superfamily N-acetyltransferase
MILSEQSMRISLRKPRAADIEEMLPALSALLREIVLVGNPMGFFPPLSEHAANAYWRSIEPELEAGTRILLTAHSEDGLIGAGQLVLAQRQNAPHRAEVEKLFVAQKARGRRVGKLLMNGLHGVARVNNRTLLLLNTRCDLPAVQFYRALGYREAGVIPGWSVGRAGEKYDHLTMYYNLETAEERWPAAGGRG